MNLSAFLSLIIENFLTVERPGCFNGFDLCFFGADCSNCHHQETRFYRQSHRGRYRVYYEVRGQVEPLLPIMGLGGHSLDWGWILPQRLADDRYKVIMLDNRGARRSDRRPGHCTIAQMAGDTVGLMDTLGIDHAHLFGGSMAGMIALQMALDHPKRIDKLVLGATTAGGIEKKVR